MEFSGVRAPDEVMCDLRSIGDAGGSLSDINAMTRSPGGDPVVTYGQFRIEATSEEARLFVGDECIAAFSPNRLRGGWLVTLDGDDYFTLSLDTGDTLIELGD
jgi:hypothetical protein